MKALSIYANHLLAIIIITIFDDGTKISSSPSSYANWLQSFRFDSIRFEVFTTFTTHRWSPLSNYRRSPVHRSGRPLTTDQVIPADQRMWFGWRDSGAGREGFSPIGDGYKRRTAEVLASGYLTIIWTSSQLQIAKRNFNPQTSTHSLRDDRKTVLKS